MKKLICLILLFFCVYFRPWENDFPIPRYNSKEFFNKTYSNYFYYSQEIKQNRLPLWNSLVGNGSTFLTEPDHSLFNPINLIVLRLLPFPFNLKILYLLSYLIAGTGIYLFIKSFKNVKANPLAGACIFLFFGPFLSLTSDLSLLQSLSYLPWLFLLANKSIVWGSLILAMQILSGPIELALITLILLFLYYRSLKIIITFCLALILSAVKLMPFFDLSNFITADLKYFFKNSSNLGSLSFFYPSLIALTALIFTRKNFYFLVIFIFCLLMSAPAISPFYIFYILPPFYWLTRPQIFFSLSGFFLAVAGSLVWRKIFSLFLLLELGFFTYLNLPQRTINQVISNLEKELPFIREVQQQGAKIWFNDKEVSSGIKALQPNNNVLWQIPALGSYERGSKRHQLFMSLISSESSKLLALQGVKYQINPTREIANPLPEEYIAKKVTVVKNNQDLVNKLAETSFNPQEESLAEQGIVPGQMKILTKSYSLGFKNIIPINFNQQGLIGNKKPVFYLASLKRGFFVSLGGFICLIVLICLRRKISFLRKFS